MKIKTLLTGLALTIVFRQLTPLVWAMPSDYGSYLGGNSIESVYGVARASDGSIYTVGRAGPGFGPVTVGETVRGNYDAFIVKLAADGTFLWGILPGEGPAPAPTTTDFATAIAIAPNGNIYVTGQAGNSSFQTTAGAFDTTYAGQGEGFVAAYDPNGTLLYSTFLGGSLTEEPAAIAIGPGGNVYVVGSTNSTNFTMSVTNTTLGTHGAYDSSANGLRDGFIVVLDPTLSTRIYGSYIGGPGQDDATGVAVDSAGIAYVSFQAASNFPTTSAAYDTSFNNGVYDAAVAAFNPNLNGSASLVWSTYLGGAGFDAASSIAFGPSGPVVVGTRHFNSPSTFPSTPGGYQSPGVASNNCGYVAQFTPTGALSKIALVGSSNNQSEFHTVAIGSDGSAYVGGFTNGSSISGSSFPITADGNATYAGGGSPAEGVLIRLSADLNSLLYASHIGGSGNEEINTLAVDELGNLLVAGKTTSTNLAVTPNAALTTTPLLDNGFLMRFVAADANFSAPCAFGDVVEIALNGSLHIGDNYLPVFGPPLSTVTLWAGGATPQAGYTEPIYLANGSVCSAATPLSSAVPVGSTILDSTGQGTVTVHVPDLSSLLNLQTVVQASVHVTTGNSTVLTGISGGKCLAISLN